VGFPTSAMWVSLHLVCMARGSLPMSKLYLSYGLKAEVEKGSNENFKTAEV